MDHYQKPHNRGVIQHPDFASGHYNPSCGDGVSLSGLIEDDTITRVLFEGNGCVISQATASMLCQKVKGTPIKDVLEYDAEFMQSLIGMKLGPTRLKCALLPLEALHTGLKKITE